MSSPTPAASAWPRKRPRVVVLLTTAFCCLPSVAGFGFSGAGGASRLPAVAADGALVSGVRAAAAAARCGERRKEWRRRRAHEITCKVSSPRRYGSAVSDLGCVLVRAGGIVYVLQIASLLSLSSHPFSSPVTCTLHMHREYRRLAAEREVYIRCTYKERSATFTACCMCQLSRVFMFRGGLPGSQPLAPSQTSSACDSYIFLPRNICCGHLLSVRGTQRDW